MSSPTQEVVDEVVDKVKTSIDKTTSVIKQLESKDDNFYRSKRNQVMLFYLFLIILFMYLGATKVFNKFLTNDDMIGAIYGAVIAMLLSKLLWILFGSNYSK